MTVLEQIQNKYIVDLMRGTSGDSFTTRLINAGVLRSTNQGMTVRRGWLESNYRGPSIYLWFEFLKFCTKVLVFPCVAIWVRMTLSAK